MDINILREAVMVLALAAFVGVVWWAYGPSRRARFERAAVSVLEDDDRGSTQGASARRDAHRGKG